MHYLHPNGIPEWFSFSSLGDTEQFNTPFIRTMLIPNAIDMLMVKSYVKDLWVTKVMAPTQ
jgi:hypothetical protein